MVPLISDPSCMLVLSQNFLLDLGPCFSPPSPHAKQIIRCLGCMELSLQSGIAHLECGTSGCPEHICPLCSSAAVQGMLWCTSTLHTAIPFPQHHSLNLSPTNSCNKTPTLSLETKKIGDVCVPKSTAELPVKSRQRAQCISCKEHITSAWAWWLQPGSALSLQLSSARSEGTDRSGVYLPAGSHALSYAGISLAQA